MHSRQVSVELPALRHLPPVAFLVVDALADEGLADHRQRALRQIAEIIGEVGVDAVDDRLMTIIAVLPERDLAQEKIPELVDPEGRPAPAGVA